MKKEAQNENKKMKQDDIVALISDSGGFDNFCRWNTSKKAEWVLYNFPCTRYTAKKVAYRI